MNGKRIEIIQERDPGKLPWENLGVDIALESTGLFTAREKASLHSLGRGPKRSLSPRRRKIPDITVCYGVNHTNYDSGSHHIISNASCTTNCLSPVAKVLHESFGVRRGLMTTVHAYTNDQRILDLPHSDIRRARAAAQSMIPTSTGAARAVGEVLPELKGNSTAWPSGPTANVSVVDLVAELGQTVSADAVNAAMRAEPKGRSRACCSIARRTGLG